MVEAASPAADVVMSEAHQDEEEIDIESLLTKAPEELTKQERELVRR